LPRLSQISFSLFFLQLTRSSKLLDIDNGLKEYVKNVFGFRPKNIHLYKLALTHKSTIQDSCRDNNERLEFLGDAILQSVVTSFLFHKYPCKEEGFLTELRSKIVCRNNLNKVACSIGLNDLLNYNWYGNVVFKFHSNIYGDALEALIGAIYLDRGYSFTEKVICDRIINLYIDIDFLNETITNFNSKLLEWVQMEKKTLKYTIVSEPNGTHKTYTIALSIDEDLISEGIDFSIKKAEQNAAEKAILKLGIE
jgi:ribonuclease-3